jgi:hypothetical protein
MKSGKSMIHLLKLARYGDTEESRIIEDYLYTK